MIGSPHRVFCFQWNISDYFYKNREVLRVSLNEEKTKVFPDFPGVPNMAAFDKLWMCLYTKLGDLCIDDRPAVRKSAGQTLFSTVAAHGDLLHQNTWQAVVWQVETPERLDSIQWPFSGPSVSHFFDAFFGCLPIGALSTTRQR